MYTGAVCFHVRMFLVSRKVMIVVEFNTAFIIDQS